MQDFTNYNPNSGTGAVSQTALSSEAVFFQRIYTWMCLGLALTAGVAYLMMNIPAWITFINTFPYALIGAFAVELGLVFYLSSRINQMTPSTAKAVFLLYSAVTGLTFSVILRYYSTPVIAKAFISTAGVYGAMAIYGLVTKRSLKSWGSFLFMGVVGIIIASLVNLVVYFFTKNASTYLMFDWVICVIGVLVFAGLTAYDHQKLLYIHNTQLGEASEDTVSRVVIIGALELYLDFINLFLFLLRIFGNSRD
ncbi:hypothetical protein C4J81_12255 [Deltaproteobacteria bacterium Smac51]|nr:hypothetical protein C4J81_12255 [Deltaproteobacteria bacterium Smac51]